MPIHPRCSIPVTSVTAAHHRPADTVLLDVRETHEWTAGHAPGARHIPLAHLRADAVPVGSAVLCICRSGHRSARAVVALRAAGIDATNVGGGMLVWESTGLPITQPNGDPGIVR